MGRMGPAGSPLIYDYLRRYQEDPTSRVFAPLAEAYRKAGMLDEAIEICRDGLRIHPQFIGGRVALARALSDKKEFAAVIEEIEPFIRDVPDNLVAQRLLGEAYLVEGRVLDALGCYKLVLYFAPEDAEAARLVAELESRGYEEGALILRKDPPEAVPETASFAEGFDVRPASQVDKGDVLLQKRNWVARVERLQILLQRVERYRFRTQASHG
jgi:tetratricopeptide (TPR) repeat protein